MDSIHAPVLPSRGALFLLSRASWDDHAVLDRTAAWAVGLLDDGDGVLTRTRPEMRSRPPTRSVPVPSTPDPWAGRLVPGCRPPPFATGCGHTVLDWALYLPWNWAADGERRLLAGVPDEACFATKLALAAALLTRAVAAGVPASFFAADEVYGSRALRSTCRTLSPGYAVAVRSNHTVHTPGGAMTCKDALRLIPAQAWQRMRTGTGAKGTRDYDWAMLEVAANGTPEGCSDTDTSVLLARQHRYTRTVSFFRCWTPAPVSPARLVWVVCRRWTIEEDFQTAKNATGLDKGAGHLLDLLAPLGHRRPDRLRLPRHHRGPRTRPG